jgi:sterol desaturase/sphingolipid hydroxylase (fatty acid hydroxylase superfamily)
MLKPNRAHFEVAVRHLLYPLLAVITLGYLAHELAGPRDATGRHHGAYIGGMIVAMIMIEAAHALRSEWRMTWATFWHRDLPFLILGASTIGAANFVAAMVVTQHAMSPGRALADVPLVPGVIASILMTDLLWYWVHRFSHEARGGLGRFLWRVHVAHHLPRQVYVLMHAISHPINAVVVRAILTIPPYFMGFSPQVVFAVSVITGLQALVSHFNVDSRVGWLNYLLVGTELHRYHHSANPAEAKNFGAVVSIWDQLFGTFVYRPGEAPRALGIDEPQRYPADTQLLSVLLHPLRRSTLT